LSGRKQASRLSTRVSSFYERIEKERVVKNQTDQYFGLSRVSNDHLEDELLSAFGYDDDQGSVIEGRKVVKQHVQRERDPGIIKRAIARAKALNGRIVCEVCNFDFEQRYGEHGSGFIEGHHITSHHTTPVSELGDSGAKTRIEDIALVRANCHRLIHHKL